MLKTGKLCYLKFGDKLQEVKVGVVDEMEGLTDDAMYGLLGGLQEAVQPHLHASLRPHRPLKVHHLSLHCDIYTTVWYLVLQFPLFRIFGPPGS
jgi:hypothetical protein